MIIKSLDVKNFKRFKSADVKLSEGLTGILGTNGTGKTSSVEMIFFALNGVSGRTLNADYIVSSFAGDGNCQVKLVFEMSGKDYCVRRTFHKGKTVRHEATLSILSDTKETQVASGVTAVDAEVRKILGMGPVDLRYTIYSPQNEHRALMNLVPSKRKEWILRMFGIDYLKDDSDEILKAESDRLVRESAKLQGELTVLLQKDPNSINTVEMEIAKIGSEIAALKLSEETLRSKLATESLRLSDFALKAESHANLFTRHKTLKTDIEDLNSKISILKTDISKCSVEIGDTKQLELDASRVIELRKLSDDIKAKQYEIQVLESKKKMLVKSKDEYNTRLNETLSKLKSDSENAEKQKNLESEVSIALNGIDEGYDGCEVFDERLASIKSSIAVIKSQIESTQTDIATKKKSLDSIQKLGSDGECPFCMQKMGDHFADAESQILVQIEESNSALVHLQTKQSELQMALSNLTILASKVSAIRTLRQGLLRHQETLTEQSDVSTKLVKVDEEIATVGSSILKLGYDPEEFNAVALALSKAESAQATLVEVGKVMSKHADLSSKLETIESQLTEKISALTDAAYALVAERFDPEEGRKINDSVGVIQDSINETTSKISMLSERESNLLQKKLELEAIVVRVGILQQQIEIYSEDIAIINSTRTEISNYVLYIMEEVRRRIEYDASEIVNRVTDGKYQRVVVDSDWNILVQDQDREYSVDRFSGGEQDVITIAIRLALSRFISDLHQIREGMPLFLDEVLSSLDEERRGNLLSVLRSMKDWFPQIFLIDHNSEVQGEFQHTLLVTGDGQMSAIREVA